MEVRKDFVDKMASWSLKAILIFIIICLGSSVVYLYKQNSSLYDQLVIRSGEAAGAKAESTILKERCRWSKE
jgi:hypothetical protein